MSDANMTDGFHLVVEALKLNGVDTIFGVAGIPISDFGRIPRRRVADLIARPPAR
jgi:oxalyl-CoA decarboxylase